MSTPHLTAARDMPAPREALRTRPPVPTDEPVRGILAYLDHPGILTLTGLEQTRLFERGDLPPGPLWYLTGLRLTEANIGSATWQLPLTGWLRSPAGVIPGGVLAFAADGALGNAIHTALGPRRVVTTSDLSLNFIRPPDPAADAVTVTARLIHTGTRQGLSEAMVLDATGHLLAHATTRCVLIDVHGELPAPPALPVPAREYGGVHPFQRPVVGRALPEGVWQAMTGLQILRAWQDGRMQRSPLSNLLGTEVIEASEGVIEIEIAASPWFVNMAGTLYGGLQALLADYAMHGAVQSVVPIGTSWATLDLKVRFVRPVAADGRPLRARSHVVHHGRQLAVVTAELVTAEGKQAALADASVLLLPGQPWDVTLVDQRLAQDDDGALGCGCEDS